MKTYQKQKDAIITLGIHRSGTSMTSSLVQRWAQYSGAACKDKIIDPLNPKGYFESTEVQSTLIDAASYLIQSKNISGWSHSFNQHLNSLIVKNTRFANALEHQFKKLRDVGVPWCSKSPMFCITVPLWEHFVEDPVLIITVRNPYDTARSLLNLKGKKQTQGGIVSNLLIWQHYLAKALQDTSKSKRRFFVSYEKIIEDPELQITKLSDFLKQEFPNISNQEGALKEMLEIVEPRLHRNVSKTNFDECSEATETQKELYALLQKIANDQTIPTDIDYDRYQLTEQEIRVLEKNKLHIIPNIRKRTLKHYWSICEYLISQLNIKRYYAKKS